MRHLIVLALLAVTCEYGRAQDVSQLYAPAELTRSGGVYGPNLRGLWEEDFQSRLTLAERQKTGTVTLLMPAVGAHGHPLDFYSDPSSGKVFLPVASIKFIDDLSIAFAYYERMGCDQGLVSDYAAVLRVRPGAAKGSPLKTLGVPLDALADPFVDDVSQKLLKSIVFFVAAHEYAHVMYRHQGYGNISAQRAQAQEAEADAFALDAMRRIGVAPTAMAHFFLIASRLEPSPVEFSSAADYEAYLRRRATHPVSASRIMKVADGIENDLDAFTLLQPKPAQARKTLEWLVPQLRKIAATLDDRDMRAFLTARALSIDVSKLPLACKPKPRHE